MASQLPLSTYPGYFEPRLEPSLSVGAIDFMMKKFRIPNLRNTLTHILEHKQQLAHAKEATTRQYVVLPILRALGWEDANAPGT